MWVLAAIGSALSFGTGDFLGGVATRRVGSAVTVVALSQIAGLAVALGFVWVFPHEVTFDAVTAGAAAGIFGAAGLVLLFRGLAIGQMGLVAPITAIGAAVVPVVYGYSTGERPDGYAIVGSVLALSAIWLVTGTEFGSERLQARAGIAEAVGAGLGFAIFFILLRETEAATGLVPLVAARVASIAALLVVMAGLQRTRATTAGARRLLVGSGVFDMAANALFLFAARAGLISIVAVLASLYPVMTVVLARLVLGEEISRRRAAGLGVAVAGIALIAL